LGKELQIPNSEKDSKNLILNRKPIMYSTDVSNNGLRISDQVLAITILRYLTLF